VTDHRIGLTLHQLDRIIEGKMDDIVDALIAHYQAEKLKQPPPRDHDDDAASALAGKNENWRIFDCRLSIKQTYPCSSLSSVEAFAAY